MKRLAGDLPFALLDLAYPRACAGCGSADVEGFNNLCWDCLAGLEWVVAPFCSVCGDPVDGLVGDAYTCSTCCRDAPSFARARSAVRFRGAMQRALHAFKYGKIISLATDLAGLLEACVRSHYGTVRFDAAAYVPLHTHKERERSFNQSRLLAKRLASLLELPLFGNCLRRVRDTSTQTNLDAFARRENVRNAFEAGEAQWTEGRTLLLVDDVMTTGATIDECARTLRKAGAAAVYAVTVARG